MLSSGSTPEEDWLVLRAQPSMIRQQSIDDRTRNNLMGDEGKGTPLDVRLLVQEQAASAKP
jgi:hypothetical protein